MFNFPFWSQRICPTVPKNDNCDELPLICDKRINLRFGKDNKERCPKMRCPHIPPLHQSSDSTCPIPQQKQPPEKRSSSPVKREEPIENLHYGILMLLFGLPNLLCFSYYFYGFHISVPFRVVGNRPTLGQVAKSAMEISL